MASFQVYSLRGRRSGVGWLGEGFSQSPLLSEWWSLADFIEWPFKLPPNVFPVEEIKSRFSRTHPMSCASTERMFRSREFKRFFMFVPHDMSERSFSCCRVLQGDLSQVTKFHKVPTL